MLPLDFTFCSGVRCRKASSCKRWTQSLYEECEKRKIDLSKKQISVSEYSHPDTGGDNCTHYIPKKEEKLQ